MKRLPPPEKVRKDLRLLGIDPTMLDMEALSAWAGSLERRASSANLVGPREMGRLWPRHVLESLAYSLLLDRRLPVVDVGSGSGLPGIPLALMGYEVVLLEPRRKRYLFLTHAVDVLGVPARAKRTRLEDWVADAPDSCQFVCRAVRPPRGMLELLKGYSGHGGSLTMRLPPGEAVEGAVKTSELVVPPLDRRGLLVQFRLPEASRNT